MNFDIGILKSFDEKWLLVEQLRVGQLWKDRLALAGVSQLNLHAKTFRQIALQLVGPLLAESDSLLVGQSAISMLIHQVLAEQSAAGKLTYFQTSAACRGNLARLMAQTFHELRLSGLDATQIDDRACEVPAKAADLREIFGRVHQRLLEARWVDYPWCVQQANDGLSHGTLHLPQPLCIVQPELFPISWLEQQLLDRLIQHGTSHLATPELVSAASRPPQTSVQAAIGPVNEVRGLFQKIIHAGLDACPFDSVEVVVTNYERYVPLILECGLSLLPQTDRPGISQLTFADGIACIYSRPGRLLRSWVRWVQAGYQQPKAVEILREGLLQRPGVAEQCGYARLANTLRRIPIGFGLERYASQIDRALTDARQRAAEDTRRTHDDSYVRDFGVLALEALHLTVQPLIALSQQVEVDSGMSILRAAKSLLSQHARADSRLDRLARSRLIDDIDLMLKLIEITPQAAVDVFSWLENLPTSSRIQAESPQPGCIHVASLEQGGASARKRLFVLGLNDDQFPKLRMMDPILLDHEREKISARLPTAYDQSRYQQAALERLMVRLGRVSDAQVTLSYSTRDLIEDRDSSPSAALAPANNNGSASHPACPIAFTPGSDGEVLNADEQLWRELLAETNVQGREALLQQRFPHLADRHRAREAMNDVRLVAFDGLVPKAGADALKQMQEHAFSPSRLEVLGTCPRKYFFQRSLGIRPPEQWSVDPDRWLSPLQLGSLLHDLFEDFVRELIANHTQSGASQLLVPSFNQHGARLTELLDKHMAEWAAQVPAPGPQCYQETREELLTTCEIFLKAEEQYAQARRAQPQFLELTLGGWRTERTTVAVSPLDTDQPISVQLSSGRTVRLLGRVDRIDQLPTTSGNSYLIWDYKSGSSYGYSPVNPFDQGRRLQHFLYVRMLEARLAEIGQWDSRVEGFGYFFPTSKNEGLRMEWSTHALSAGDSIVSALLDLLAAGTFIATDKKDDCNLCDYGEVCGQPEDLVQLTAKKTLSALNHQLSAWRILRPSK